MRLPWMITLLGYAGLLPFLSAPLWLTIAPETVPAWLDRAWWMYVALIAVFLAGTFWGFALPAAMGPAGMAGILMASALMWMVWVALLLPFQTSLYLLSLTFLLLLLADFWRERTLDTIPGYFAMRSVLTVGVILAIVWRLALGIAPASQVG